MMTAENTSMRQLCSGLRRHSGSEQQDGGLRWRGLWELNRANVFEPLENVTDRYMAKMLEYLKKKVYDLTKIQA